MESSEHHIKLVNELVSVSVKPLLRWHGYFVQVPTVLSTLAGLDEHDCFVETPSSGALKRD